MLAAAAVTALSALGFVVAVQSVAASDESVATDEIFNDPAEDNPMGLAPDITRITVSTLPDGELRIRIETPNRSSELATDAVVMYMNTDLNAATGSSGSDYRIEAYGGDPGVFLAHWSGSSWDRVSSTSFSSSFSGGVSASLRRSDLGNTNGFSFFVVTYSNGREPDWAPDDATAGARLTARLGTTAPPTTTTTAPPSSAFTKLVARVRSGVIRIEVDTCNTRRQGTGILLGSRLVATVEHVVDRARKITLKRDGKNLGPATIIGENRALDLTLLRSSKNLTGNQFRLAGRAPNLGEAVAVLGYPLGLPLTVTRGTVSGLSRSVRINGVLRRGLVQTDAAVNSGNSGGPLLSVETEEVVGLVDITSVDARGIAFAVSSKLAAPLIEKWKTAPKPVAPARC